MDPLAIAVSGIHSAEIRLGASAHNVANLTTPDFRPLRTVQTTLAGGGSTARAQQVATPEEVGLAHEIVEQIRAGLQFRASLRVLATHADLTGSLVDLFA